jgi:hypothetical protein
MKLSPKPYLPLAGFRILIYAVPLLAASGANGQKVAQAPLDAAQVKDVVGNWVVGGAPIQRWQVLKEGDVVTYGHGAKPASESRNPIIVVTDLAGGHPQPLSCPQWNPCNTDQMVIKPLDQKSGLPGSQFVRELLAFVTDELSRRPSITTNTSSRGSLECGQNDPDGIAFPDQGGLNFNALDTTRIPDDDKKNKPGFLRLTPVPPFSNGSPIKLEKEKQWKGAVEVGLYRMRCNTDEDRTDQGSWVLVLPADVATKTNWDFGKFSAAFEFWRDGQGDTDFHLLLRGFLAASFEKVSSH